MYSQIDANKRKTIFLFVIFFILIIAIGWFAGVYLDYGYGIFLFAVIFSIVTSLVSYYQGDAIALLSAGAKEIDKGENAYLYRMVENVAITAGIPTPKVYVIESNALNAFATGRDPKHASVAFTTGLIKALTNEELEGVTAHELSHVKNYDIRVMTVVVVLVGLTSLLADFFFRATFWGGHKKSSDSNHGNLGTIIAIVGVVLIILSPVIAELIKLAISRKREYLADASGALLTRYPEGLASALEKISASSMPLQTANAATAHLFISNPLKHKSFSRIFSTHPPIEERIRRLREMI